MAPDIETSHSVRTWAQASFPDSFAKFDDFTGSVEVLCHTYEGRVTDGIRVHEGDALRIVHVGIMANGSRQRVHAWTENNGSVSLGHKSGSYIAVHNDTTNPLVLFDKPYCWVKPAEDETGAARFESLVCYYTCVRGTATGIRSGISTFKEHFPGACLDVAEQMVREALDEDSGVRRSSFRMRLKKQRTAAQSPKLTPALVPTATPAPTAPTTLEIANTTHHSGPPTPTAITNEPLHPLDQAFAAFKTTLATQLTLSRANEAHEKAALTTRVHSLELSLASAEAERDKLQGELVAAREEAERWKEQYEGLTRAVRDTVERGF